MAYIIYSFFSLSFGLLGLYVERYSRFLLFVIVVLTYCLVFGFSYKSGSDWFNYERDFYNGCEASNFEFGYSSVCKLFSSIGVAYWVFSFFVKSAYILVVAWFVQKLRTYSIAVLSIYILISSVLLENLLRQQIAAGFMLIAFYYLPRYSSVFLVLCGLAACFHVSALACLPVIIIYRFSAVRSAVFSLSCIAFLLQSFGIFTTSEVMRFLLVSFPENVVSQKLLFYIGFDTYPVTIGHFLRFFLLVLYWVLYRRYIKLADAEGVKELICLVYSALLLMLFYEMVFYDFSVFWMRVREFFTLFLIAYPLCLSKWFVPSYRFLTYCGVTLYAAIVFSGFFNLPVYTDLYSGYRNYLIESLGKDVRFNSVRDDAAEEYWAKWKREKGR